MRESRREEGIGVKLTPGGFFWSDALITLLAKDPDRFFARAGELSAQMRILARCINGKSGRERSQGLCDAVNTLYPGTCSMDGDRIVWSRAFMVGGRSVSEIDFFLGHDLLDKEE